MDTYLKDLQQSVQIGVTIMGEADRGGVELRQEGSQVLQAVARNLQAHLSTATDKTKVGHDHWLRTFDSRIAVVGKLFATVAQVATRLLGPEQSIEIASWSEGDWFILASCLITPASGSGAVDPRPYIAFLEHVLAQAPRIIAEQRSASADLNNKDLTQLRGTLCAVADHLATLLVDHDVPQHIKDRLAKIYEIAGWGNWRSEFEKNADGERVAESSSAPHTVTITVFLGELLQSQQVVSIGPSKTTIRIVGGGEGDVFLPIAHDNYRAVVELSSEGVQINSAQPDDLAPVTLNGCAIGRKFVALQHGDIVLVGPYRLEFAIQRCDCKG